MNNEHYLLLKKGVRNWMWQVWRNGWAVLMLLHLTTPWGSSMNLKPEAFRSFWFLQGESISEQPPLITLSRLVIMAGLALYSGQLDPTHHIALVIYFYVSTCIWRSCTSFLSFFIEVEILHTNLVNINSKLQLNKFCYDKYEKN